MMKKNDGGLFLTIPLNFLRNAAAGQTMSESLQTRLNQLRKQIRALLWVYGVSLLFSVLVGSTLLVGFLDWWLHFDDASVRLVLGLAIISISSWIGWRALLTPLLSKLSDIELALKIEQRYPGFRDSLASTVQFQESGIDPRNGAPELQQEVIERTLEEAKNIRVEEILETRRVWNVVGIATVVAIVTCCLVTMNQVEAGTAIQRLMFPFAEHPWPRSTILVLTDADLNPLPQGDQNSRRVARGTILELFVVDQLGSLPDDVHMEYRIDDQEIITEQLQKASIPHDDGTQTAVCVARLQAIKGPIFVRATGGDDLRMEWHQISVVPPPVVENFQITLIPPKYTNENTEKLPQNVGHVRGMVGTQVKLTARANKKLTSAHLRVKNLSPELLVLGEDGRSFSAEFMIEDAGHQTYTWWLDLLDTEGFSAPDPPRYDVQSLVDQVPDIYFEEPTSDLRVTSTATVPLKLKTKDDLGLNRVELIYRLNDSEDAPRISIPLFEGGHSETATRPQQLMPEYDWKLTSLKLPVGSRIQLHGEARDDYDLGEPHVGRTQPLSLFIVSSEEKIRDLLKGQDTVLEELARILELQKRARQGVSELGIQLSKVGELRKQDVDALTSLEYEHRHQISGKLVQGETPTNQTIEEQIRRLLQEFRDNQLQAPEMKSRLEQVQNELSLLKKTDLPAVGRQLNAALKQSTGTTPDATQSLKSLKDAGKSQELVVESLEAMIGELSEWQHQQDVGSDIQNLITEQENLNQSTGELQQQTLGRPLGALTPQEKADLAKLSATQRKQGDQVETLKKKLERIASELNANDAATAETIADTLAQLKQTDAGRKMQEVANLLDENNIGQATTEQQELLDELQELRDILNNRGVSDTETLVKKLKQAEEELKLIKKAQTELLQKKREADSNPESLQKDEQLQQLKKEQQELREQAETLSRKLRRLQARRPSQSLKRAAESMQKLEKQTQSNPSPNKQDEGDQEKDAQESLDDLKQAEQELAQEREQAEEQLARELLERIADELPGFVKQQQAIIDETERLQKAVQERGNWSRTLSKTVKTLAETQQNLREDTETLMERLKIAEVLVLALEGAARNMDQAADRLSDRQVDADTVSYETVAMNRFLALIEALKPEKSASQQPGQNPETPSQQEGPPGEGIPPLAQLKLMKTLQQEINLRTAELHQLREKKELTEIQQQELSELSVTQGKLADLATKLVQEVRKAFESETLESEPTEK